MNFQDYADRFLTIETPTPKALRWSGVKAAFAEGWDWTAFEDIGATAELYEAGHGGYAPDISSEMVSPEDLPTAATEARRRGTMSRVSNEMARSMAQEADVEVDSGEASYTKAAAKIMIDRAVERKQQNFAGISSGNAPPSGKNMRVRQRRSTPCMPALREIDHVRHMIAISTL